MWFALWMERFVLIDAQWAKMEPHCLGKPTDPGGRSGRDNRLFMEPVLFRDWREVDVFKRIFNARQRNRTWKGGLRARPSVVPKAA